MDTRIKSLSIVHAHKIDMQGTFYIYKYEHVNCDPIQYVVYCHAYLTMLNRCVEASFRNAKR